MEHRESIKEEVRRCGGEILNSRRMQEEKAFRQHGRVSVFAHSFAVACMSLYLARIFRVRADRRALVRGALLHDYFLYDWHVPDRSHRLHGFTHPGAALRNAERDFPLNAVERDAIARHMFPLTPVPPKYRESVLVCAADKLCALCETFSLLGWVARRTYERRPADKRPRRKGIFRKLRREC